MACHKGLLKNPEPECTPPMAGCGFTISLSDDGTINSGFKKTQKQAFALPKSLFRRSHGCDLTPDCSAVGSRPPAQARPDRTQTGVIHIGGAEYLSRYDFAVRVAERFGFDKTNIYPTKTHILKQEAKRLLHGGLKVEKAQSLLKTKLLNVEEGLEQARQNAVS